MKNNKRNTTLDYVKANTHGEWLANNENEKGFVSKHKVHTSTRQYKRKNKHKEDLLDS